MNNASNDLRRRRKAKELQNGRSGQKRKAKAAQSNIYQSFLCMIICGVILTSLIVLYTDSIPWHVGHKAADQIAKAFGYYEPVHAVVIDAGSTGSRVLAFTFHKAVIDGHLVLDKELFVHTKPGLSAFADDPQKAVQSITTLIDKAKQEIPQEFWNKTPIILKATAGLRLLPPAKAEALLNAMRTLFKGLPFITNDQAVEIMDGTDEGIFSWFTVNYLLNIDDPSKTFAALDLGGGSTQVTFSAITPATLKQKEFIHNALLPKGEIQVYTNSYLGLGLMAARKEILTFGQKNNEKIISECINPIIKSRKFHYGGVDYFVNGLQENYTTIKHAGEKFTEKNEIPVVNIKVCSEIVKNYVLSKVEPLEELSNKRIFAFSYYFDRAAETGLIEEFGGGTITIQTIKKKAKEVCLEANTEQPFMCLDLTFISILLEDGLGLHEETKIHMYKKINGHEISWALGAAYNMLKGRK